MPTPSKAELWDQITKYAKVVDQIWKFGAENATNYLDLEDAVRQALEGDHSTVIASDLDSIRSTLSTLYSGRSGALMRLLKELARVGYNISIAGLSNDEIIDKIAFEMNAASETIASRDLNLGSVSAGGANVSTGVMLRQTVDRFGDEIESSQMGIVKIEVVKDQNSGTEPGKEELRIYGSGVTKSDEIDLGTATNKVGKMSFFGSRNSAVATPGINILRNPSFDSLEGTLTKNVQTGWQLNDFNDFTTMTQATGDIFRFNPSTIRSEPNPTGQSLRIDGNDWFAQYFTKEQLRVPQDPNAPFCLCMVWMRKSSADGTLTLRLGSQTEAFTVNTFTNDVWNFSTLGIDSSKGYYENFVENWVDTSGSVNIPRGVRVRVDYASWTTGAVTIGHMFLGVGYKFDGFYYFPLPGDNTGSTSGDAQIADSWTFTDAYTSGSTAQGRTQEVIQRETGRHLPHTTGAETYADA